MGNVLLYVHEDLGDDFFCMICTSMTHTCHIVSCLALKSYFLVVLEISPFRVMVVTQIMESLIYIYILIMKNVIGMCKERLWLLFLETQIPNLSSEG